MGLSYTISEINGDFSRKSQIFSPPCSKRPCRELGFLRNWITALVLKNQNCGASTLRKCMMIMFSRFDTTHQCERQTGGNWQWLVPRFHVASCGKNCCDKKLSCCSIIHCMPRVGFGVVRIDPLRFLAG